MTETLPVYQMIDGKRVRKVSDERDPRRRYHSVLDVSSGEDYLVEFTDAEERARDAEETRWEAERPQREAERLADQERQEAFRGSLIYTPRIVAFLDVLGWREAIGQSIRSEELQRRLGVGLASIRPHIELADWLSSAKSHGDPQIAQFSDSLVVSYDAAQPRFIELQLVTTLRAFCDRMLEAGLFVRGAVTLGPLVHKKAVAYGPALVRAYDLERGSNPRIVLDPDLALMWGNGLPVKNTAGRLLETWRFWRRDRETGEFFLDFLSPLPHFSPDAETATKLEKARSHIETGLSHGDLKIVSKYRWLRNYFNEVAPDLSVPPITTKGPKMNFLRHVVHTWRRKAGLTT